MEIYSHNYRSNSKTKETWFIHHGPDPQPENSSHLVWLENQTQQLQWGGMASFLGGEGNIPSSNSNDTDNNDNIILSPPDGQAYCFLPLPISTGLPVHVNAFFALSSNRRTLWMGDKDTSGNNRIDMDINVIEFYQRRY